MADQNTRRALKIALVVAALVTVVAFFPALNLLKLAHKENPDYARWQMLPDEKKSLKTEDGRPAHPIPEKQIPLTTNETIILGAGLASFAFLPTFFICFLILRRKQ